MNKILLAIMALALVVGPAMAAKKKAMVDRGPNSVWCGGDYIGSDPDPQVRLKLLKEYQGECSSK